LNRTYKSIVISLVIVLALLAIPLSSAFAAEGDSPLKLTDGVKQTITEPVGNNPAFNTSVQRDQLPEAIRNFTGIAVIAKKEPHNVDPNKLDDYKRNFHFYDNGFGSFVIGGGHYYILTILFNDVQKPIAYYESELELNVEGTGGSTGGTTSGKFGTLDHIEANEQSILLKSGQSKKIKIYAMDTNGREKEITSDKKIVFRSDSASVANVSAGVVKAGSKEGTANIIVTFEGKKVTIPVTVAPTVLTGLKASLKEAQLEPQELRQVKLTAVFSDGSVKDVTTQAVWMTDNSEVADVDTGEIEAFGPGEAVISAAYSGLSVNIAVSVVEAQIVDGLNQIVSLEASNKNIKMKTNEEKMLQIYAVYDDGTKEEVTDAVLWQTSKSDIVEVDAGVLTAGQSGKAIVTATYENQSIQVTVQVEKEKAIKSLTVSTKKVSIKRGNEKELSLTAVYMDGTKADVSDTAEWVSKNDSIADVDAGVVTANHKGSTVITAKYNGKFVNIIVKVN
jgi:hypothetical protein